MKNKTKKIYLIVILKLLTINSYPINFLSPLQCEINKNCIIKSYPEIGQEISKTDYKCGKMIRKNNKSTTFKLLNPTENIIVQSVANGKVIQINNKFNQNDQTNHSCNYGVSIEHENGIQTQYCNLNRKSINLKINQTIYKGEKIGFVNTNTKDTLPEFKFLVLKNNQIIDPFTGDSTESNCKASTKNTLWGPFTNQELEYNSGKIYQMGYTNKRPTKNIYQSKKLTLNKPNFLWLKITQVVKNDIINIIIKRNDGKKIEKIEKYINKTLNDYFMVIEFDLNETTWLKNNTHYATLDIIRNKKKIDTKKIELHVSE